MYIDSNFKSDFRAYCMFEKDLRPSMHSSYKFKNVLQVYYVIKFGVDFECPFCSLMVFQYRTDVTVLHIQLLSHVIYKVESSMTLSKTFLHRTYCDEQILRKIWF